MTTLRVYTIHPLGRFRCFVFDNLFEFAKFQHVKTKASVTPFMYICLPSLSPIGLSARLNILPVMSVCDLTWSLTDANLVDYFELTNIFLKLFLVPLNRQGFEAGFLIVFHNPLSIAFSSLMFQYSKFFKAFDNFVNRSTSYAYCFSYLFHCQRGIILDRL